MKALWCAVLACTLSACSSPRSTKIPPDLADIAKIQSSLDKLDSADRRRVATYETRAHLGSIFGQTAPPAGVTIGEAIDSQEAFELAEEAKANEEKRIAAEAAAKEAIQRRALDSSVTVGLVRVAPTTAGYMDAVEIELAFKNTSTKPMAGVKGDAVFRDMFGDTLDVASVSYDQSVAPGETRTWTGSRSVLGSFGHNTAKLRTTPTEKVQFTFLPSMIVFADGTKLQVPDAP